MDDRPSDMYQDMMKLNMLYEEMCWDNEDIIESVSYTHLRAHET